MIAFLALVAALTVTFTWRLTTMTVWAYPSEIQRQMALLAARVEALHIEIGTRLLPAFRRLAVAISGTAAAFAALQNEGKSDA